MMSQPVVLITLLCLFACIFLYFYLTRRAFKAADWVVDHQYDVVDEADLSGYRSQVPEQYHRQWDDLLVKVKERNRSEPLRLGQALWMHSAVQSQEPTFPIPDFRPPADLPYNIKHDRGIVTYLAFLRTKEEKRWEEAFDLLRRGAEDGSPICLAFYGTARMNGDIPGQQPDPTGAEMIKEAAARGCTMTMLYKAGIVKAA